MSNDHLGYALWRAIVSDTDFNVETLSIEQVRGYLDQAILKSGYAPVSPVDANDLLTTLHLVRIGA